MYKQIVICVSDELGVVEGHSGQKIEHIKHIEIKTCLLWSADSKQLHTAGAVGRE